MSVKVLQPKRKTATQKNLWIEEATRFANEWGNTFTGLTRNTFGYVATIKINYEDGSNEQDSLTMCECPGCGFPTAMFSEGGTAVCECGESWDDDDLEF